MTDDACREHPSRRYGFRLAMKRFTTLLASVVLAGAAVAQMNPQPQSPVRIELGNSRPNFAHLLQVFNAGIHKRVH